MNKLSARIFIGATLLASGTGVWAADHVFDAGFDHRAEGPYSTGDAARFLTQATMGPSLAEIAHLESVGFNAWFSEQAAAPASHHRPYLEAREAAGDDVYQNIRQEAWFQFAIQADDQLRQRVAFALSEIFVVSDQSGAIEGYPIPMAQYYDVLVDGAFGNYRNLLKNVTLSPVMGHYLSMFKNRKPDEAENIRPDENYAREIMQLFSIGLVQLNQNGTVITSGGQPVPTYNQDTIRGFAHVFTGWNWANCPTSQPMEWWEFEYCPSGPVEWPEEGWEAYWLVPMMPYDDFHASEGTKQLLIYPGVALAGGVLPAGGTAQADLDAALDNIFNHPNVAPFIAQHLIKRLVTSNPSPAYVGRVATIFNNNGTGVRGDLHATVRAVLMDSEARTVQPLASNAGKLREPLLRLTQLWRAFDGRADDGRYREWYINYYFAQAPLSSPTVFNFFLPSYQPPGELATLGLIAPEFQITTDTTVASVANVLGDKVYWAWRGNDDVGPEDIVVDLGPELTFANDPARLVDRYDLLLMGRTMSNTMYNTLVTYLQSLPASNTDERRERVQEAIWLIQTSPEYSIER